MTDEPFALSTIPPALPAEADYDTIHAAVMRTVRGRWFLEEYARRNRNADTALVLDAVARIEGVIRGEQHRRAQKGLPVDLPEQPGASAETGTEAAEIAPDPAVQAEPAEPAPDPPPDIFAAAERLQDMAWTLRERGADPSVCEMIEAVASTILSATSLRNPGDHRARKLGEVLQYLEHRIDRMLDGCAETRPAFDERRAETGDPSQAPAGHGGDGEFMVSGGENAQASKPAADGSDSEGTAAPIEPCAPADVAPDLHQQPVPELMATKPRIEIPEIDLAPLAVAKVSESAPAADKPVEIELAPVKLVSPSQPAMTMPEIGFAAPPADPLLLPASRVAQPTAQSAEREPADFLTAPLPIPLTAGAPTRPQPVAASPPLPQPAQNDPLAALKAMSEAERIALFT